METAQTKGRWCKLAEAAQLLGISEITVRRKAKAGQFKTILRNGKYMVFLEENTELGLFMGTTDQTVTPTLSMSPERRNQYTGLRRSSDEAQSTQNSNDGLIHSLKRTIEDQQTLIASLEDSIARMRQRLLDERNSNK